MLAAFVDLDSELVMLAVALAVLLISCTVVYRVFLKTPKDKDHPTSRKKR